MIARHNIFSSIWMMDKQSATDYYPLIHNYLKGTPTQTMTHRSEELAQFEGNIHTNKDGANILVLPIKGTITKNSQYCGPRGMEEQSMLLLAAYQQEDIQGIILKIESGGGEGNAMRLLQETLKLRNKTVIAYVEDLACSAAYGIASQTDYIVANSELARVGSIGVYLTVADYTEYYKKQGVKLIEIYAPQSTEKNKEYFDAISGDTKALQEQAKRYAEAFIQSIAKARELDPKKDGWATGKTFFADKALQIGLIDKIDNFENVMNYF